MKKLLISVLFTVLMVLYGCQSVAPSQTTFKANFSLDGVVEGNKQYLLEDARVLSVSEVGSNEPFVQSAQEMSLQIDRGNTHAFMEALRSGIEQALLDSNARIVGTETSGNDHFAFTYTENGVHGTIHVWGIPGEETDFKIILLITEG